MVMERFMSGPDYRMMQEAEEEQMAFRLAIVKRIESGMSTVSDAEYVAGSFGLTNFYKSENRNGNYS
jgi:hypothetical protein